MAINIHTDQTVGRPINPAAGRGRSAEERLTAFVEGSTVMLFVKGQPMQPMCGFSATVMDIFNRIGVPYATFDVLSDPDIRQGAKQFSQWPTFPQIYVAGEFIGGCDIAIQMFQEGELQELVQGAFKEHGPGRALVAEDAADEDAASAVKVEVPASARASDEGVAEVRQIGPRKASLMGLESFLLLDVRQPHEVEIADINAPSHLIPLGELPQRLGELPKDAKILVYCRTGGRSQKAGELLVSQGHRHVWNLAGGVHAWSDEIDSSLPKY